MRSECHNSRTESREILYPSCARIDSSSMPTFDMVVIGSGPAGQRAAIQGAKLKKRVALIEKIAALGGCCINTGTIPSKTMREAVLHLSGYHYQNIYGINYRVKEKITMSDLLFRVQHVIKTEIDVTQAQLSRNGIDMISGVAQFVDPTHIRVLSALGQADYEAASIVIATGTKPAESSKVPLNGRNIVNSDQILQMTNLQNPDRGGRRRNRHRIHLHVRRFGSPRDPRGEAAPF